MGSTGKNDSQRIIPEAQQKTLNRIIQKTKNLKNEQYRIVDKDGNILLERKGDNSSVAGTVGEKREFMMNNIGIHNHPDGGTFSSEDFKDFGWGATDIVVASPEGVYKLSADDIKGNNSHGRWLDMKEAYERDLGKDVSSLALLQQARKNLSDTEDTKLMNNITKKWAEIKEKKGIEEAYKYADATKNDYDNAAERHKKAVEKEARRIGVAPYHEWLIKNAKKYGYTYTFTPHKKKGK